MNCNQSQYGSRAVAVWVINGGKYVKKLLSCVIAVQRFSLKNRKNTNLFWGAKKDFNSVFASPSIIIISLFWSLITYKLQAFIKFFFILVSLIFCTCIGIKQGYV